ncbi:hypothetical protein Sfin2_26 [Shigella phage Sfin-2]|uniref:Uncharacterized protein n=2 Tax=Tunavirus Sfin1 TaxID=2734026 RepID=A0A5Q5APU3_9CAUD|nr:hypothetical protein Sfin2_26 [Shigella phage Sfin-2]QGZ15939.1 hypothetical protein Sfin6_0031 [Shigella phage Sfin-6]
MKRFKVKLIIRKMGMFCQSCKQSFETEVSATSQAEAIAKAKNFPAQTLTLTK